MPERPIHAEGTYVHYVTFSCFKRRQYLQKDICKRIVIGTLGSQLSRQKGICTGFVVMPDHVHVLIWFPDEFQISDFMGKWKELTSKQLMDVYRQHFPEYVARIDPNDPIWQVRYYDFNVYSEKKLREKLEYMHNNPVRAGLVSEACDWPWSSALCGSRENPLVFGFRGHRRVHSSITRMAKHLVRFAHPPR